MGMMAVWPSAAYIEDEPPVTFDRATLPSLKPRSIFCGDFPASLAARSTIFRIGDFLPFLQISSVLTLTFWQTVRNCFQRSGFSIGRPAAFFHLFFLHAGGRLWFS